MIHITMDYSYYSKRVLFVFHQQSKANKATAGCRPPPPCSHTSPSYMPTQLQHPDPKPQPCSDSTHPPKPFATCSTPKPLNTRVVALLTGWWDTMLGARCQMSACHSWSLWLPICRRGEGMGRGALVRARERGKGEGQGRAGQVGGLTIEGRAGGWPDR